MKMLVAIGAYCDETRFVIVCFPWTGNTCTV